jgi:hypothetical protein
MNSEDNEHDDLWRLLGKAKEPRVSPFFDRNVLRAIREEASPRRAEAWAWWRLFGWRWLSMGALGAAVLLLSQIQQPAHRAGPVPYREMAQQVWSSPDLSVIGNLDELLAFEEDSLWLDAITF